MDLLAFILAISADGITDEQVQTALNAYIAEHPEAVTTVTDGSITKVKLDSNLQATVDDVGVLKSAINAYIDSSDYLDGFPNTPVYNATYTSGKIADWGTATKRIINTTTLSYPMDVIYTANLGYEFYAYTFAEPHTFTGNGSVANTGGSGAWVKEYHANAFSNVLLIVRKTNTTNIYVTDWPNAISAIAYPTDLTIVTEKLKNLLVNNTEYYVKGKSIDVSRQYYTVKNLSFYPTEETGKTMQGVAVYGGVVVQMFSDGSAELFDMSTGNKIITLNMNAGHGGSASFSDTFFDVNDEFPFLYVASFEAPKTYVYRITRLDYTLVKTYYTPIEIAGYRQESCYDKFSGTLWVIGYVADSKTAGEGWVVTNWDLTNTTDNGDGTYTPTLITTFQLPFIPYVQSISVFNNQLFVVTGIDLHANPEELTRIWVIDKYDHAVISVMDMFPETILNAEPEGIDFIGTGHKYDMFLATRANKAYYIISIDH